MNTFHKQISEFKLHKRHTPTPSLTSESTLQVTVVSPLTMTFN